MEKLPITWGMATYDDFDGLYFSLKAVQLYSPEFFESVEIVVVDNHPEGVIGKNIEVLCQKFKPVEIKYVPLKEPVGTSPSRQKIFEVATREWCLVNDSHVLYHPGALECFTKYALEHPDSKDIISGPLVGENGLYQNTHFIPKWRGRMLGIWGVDKRADDPNAEPFEIPGCGLGSFACRKDVWPGFHPLSRGFGGEEIYIHEKFRRNGGIALCLPCFKWSHRFGRPLGTIYPLKIWHRVRNYILEYKELGWDVNEIKNYFVGCGYFTEEDWKLLITDPENRIDPPLTFEIADGERNKEKMLKLLEAAELAAQGKIPQDAPTLEPAKNLQQQNPNIRVVSSEEELRQIIRNLPLEQQEDIVKKFRANPPKKGCCGGTQTTIPSKNPSQERPQTPQQKQLPNITTFEQLYEFVPKEFKQYESIIEEFVKKSEVIIDISEDVLHTSPLVMKYLQENTTFSCFHHDTTKIDDLNIFTSYVARNKQDIGIHVGTPTELYNEIDLALINLAEPTAKNIYELLVKLAPKTKRIIIFKTEKYGFWDKQSKPGMRHGLIRFLIENQSVWSVVSAVREGVGLTVLSKIVEDKPKRPKYIQMASTFAKALTKYIASGMNEVTKEQYQERLEICSTCPNRNNLHCSECGCPISTKARWATESCPLGFWLAIVQKQTTPPTTSEP